MSRLGAPTAVVGVLALAAALAALWWSEPTPKGLDTDPAVAGTPEDLPPARGSELRAPAPEAASVAPVGDPNRASLTVLVSGSVGRREEAQVLARPDPDGAASRARLQRAPLAPGGRARLALVPGRWHVAARTLGGQVVLGTVDLTPGERTLTCDAARLPGLELRVVDRRGRPVPGAQVTLAAPHTAEGVAALVAGAAGPPPTTSGVVGETDDAGRLAWTLLPPDQLYRLDVSHPSHQPLARDGLSLREDAPTRLGDLVLGGGRTLSGRVEDEAGLPVPECPVVALVGARRERRSTDPAGTFRFTGLPPGEGRVWTEDDLAVDAAATIPPTGDHDTLLLLRQGAFIEGTLHFPDGTPGADLRLFGQPLGSGTESLGARLARPRQVDSDTTGAFRLGPFPPGPVLLREPLRSQLQQVVVAPATVDLELPAPHLWEVGLSFVEASSGQPVTDPGRAQASWGGPDGGAGVGDLEVRPDEQGRWLFRQEAPGDVALSLELAFPGRAPKRLTWQPGELEPGAERTVQLEAARLLGVLVTSAQAPVSGARVELLWPASRDDRPPMTQGALVPVADSPFPGRSALVLSGRSDERGRVQLERLHDGPLLWRVSASGFQPATGRLELVPPARPVDEDEPPALVVPLEPTASGG